jgi:hypothetical protein
MVEKIFSLLISLATLATMPASSAYKLNNYTFGNGGTANSTSPNFGLNATTGEQGGLNVSSPNYQAGTGEKFTQQAHVPPAPVLENTGDWYNKLHFVVNAGPNAADATFAIAISDDNFTTTKYIQSDNTVAAALGIEDYQTYAAWGGASGGYVVGLTSETTYTIKVKAMQGRFTETGFGPTASADTSPPSLTFSVSPNSIDFGDLLAATVTDAPQPITVSFATNGEQGGNVYINGLNTGLRSSLASYTIGSTTGDLSALSEGFGARVTASSQTSGGPISGVAPYDGTGDNVGLTDTVIRRILTSSAPIVDGSGSVLLKAKATTMTPAALDYTETLTMVASASF